MRHFYVYILSSKSRVLYTGFKYVNNAIVREKTIKGCCGERKLR